MFFGQENPNLDRRALATVLFQEIAKAAEKPETPLDTLVDMALEASELLLEHDCRTKPGLPTFRVITGGKQ